MPIAFARYCHQSSDLGRSLGDSDTGRTSKTALPALLSSGFLSSIGILHAKPSSDRPALGSQINRRRPQSANGFGPTGVAFSSFLNEMATPRSILPLPRLTVSGA